MIELDVIIAELFPMKSLYNKKYIMGIFNKLYSFNKDLLIIGKDVLKNNSYTFLQLKYVIYEINHKLEIIYEKQVKQSIINIKKVIPNELHFIFKSYYNSNLFNKKQNDFISASDILNKYIEFAKDYLKLNLDNLTKMKIVFDTIRIDYSFTNITTMNIDEEGTTKNSIFKIKLYQDNSYSLICPTSDFLFNILNRNYKQYISLPITFYNQNKKFGHEGVLIFCQISKICYYVDPNGIFTYFNVKYIKEILNYYCNIIHYKFEIKQINNLNQIIEINNLKFNDGYCVNWCYFIHMLIMNCNQRINFFDQINKINELSVFDKNELIQIFSFWIYFKLM